MLEPQFQMFLDHPAGAGYRGNALLSRDYMPPELLSNSGLRGAHNTFMAALVDQGLPGAILLISLYIWMFISLVRLKRLDELGLAADLAVYRAAIGAALASCVASGLFLNLLTFEVQVWLVTLLGSLTQLCVNAVAKAQGDGEAKPQPARRGGRKHRSVAPARIPATKT
jgi:O-antigen ligase